MRNTIAILGIPIDDLDMEQVIDRLDQFVRSGRFHQVATANTDFLIKARADAELQAILRCADLVVPDGMPIVWASRWLRNPLRERVTGADLVPRLARAAAEQSYRVFLLGAREEVARTAQGRLEADNPGLKIVGRLSPPVASLERMDHEAILAEIREAAPDVLLVAFGNPKQEKWLHMHRDRLAVPVCIGIGGTLDFIAGATARAPEAWQRAGLEWLHRLLHEPRRLWRRYAVDLVQFGRFIAAQLWSMRGGGHAGPSRLSEAAAGECVVLSVAGRLGADVLPRFQQAAERALDAPAHLVLDLQAVTEIDSAALGTLINLPKRAAFAGREVRVVGMTRKVAQVLEAAAARTMLPTYATVADALHGRETAAVAAETAVETSR